MRDGCLQHDELAGSELLRAAASSKGHGAAQDVTTPIAGSSTKMIVEAAVGLSYAPPTTIFILDEVDLTR